MDDRPIGVFDSGFGGLTVARAMIDLLPAEDIVYLGDTGRYPYGPRPLDEVQEYARQITHFLVKRFDVKMPKNKAASPRIMELPSTAEAVTNASTIREK